MRIVIAGAGLGGLTAALALLRKGFEVTICERTETFAPIGAGIQIGPNASRVLLALGLEEALAPVVCEATGKEVRLWNTGDIWPLFDLGADCRERFGAPYWTVHRGDLHQVLVDAVEVLSPGAIRLCHAANDVSQSSDGAILHTSKGNVKGDVAIAADGVHSSLRDALFQSPKARFTGLTAWRGLAPMEALPDALRRPVGANWVGPGAHVITYPVRDGTRLNFVGVVENDNWTGESWSESGTHDECAADFMGWHPHVQQIIGELETPFRWALVEREPLQTWSQGRVAMLGDACHATLPFLAQGAGMAIEDGWILADCLAEDSLHPEKALRRYASLRQPRTSAVIAGSSANAGRFHNPDLAHAERARAYLQTQWEPDKVRQRYDWLFDYDALSATQESKMS